MVLLNQIHLPIHLCMLFSPSRDECTGSAFSAYILQRSGDQLLTANDRQSYQNTHKIWLFCGELNLKALVHSGGQALTLYELFGLRVKRPMTYRNDLKKTIVQKLIGFIDWCDRQSKPQQSL